MFRLAFYFGFSVYLEKYRQFKFKYRNISFNLPPQHPFNYSETVKSFVLCNYYTQ